mmetsp:Transcript_28101/g.67694  ORF Transcript_28101/g.67694 Transcript_28101/m.67694 type:complete len:487 (-) Transcript_28101:194-1654(-)
MLPNRMFILFWIITSEVAAAWIAPRHSANNPSGAKRPFSVRASTVNSNTSEPQSRVLILGGTGLVGRHVVDLLDRQNIPFVATSTQGRDGTTALDLTDADASQKLLEICETNEISAIVSTVGSIFSERDYEINLASGRTAAAAFDSEFDKDGGAVPRYIFIGNSQRVRNVCNIISTLKDYARGKEEAENFIQETFAEKCCIIKPTFIYGGREFSISPPRLPTGLGEIIEAVLGLYPIQATSEALPDILGVTLEAPVNVESVAGAIVNLATGLCDDSSLDTREDIIMAASQRPAIGPANQSPETEKRRDELKTILSNHALDHTPDENFSMLEELERLKPTTTRPTDDSSLNGRWDFCFDVEPDVGTGFIKDLFDGNGPAWLKKIVDFQGVHMEIENKQTDIRLVVSVAVFKKDVSVILKTSLSPAQSNPDGTMFMEKFEGIELNGFLLPYPNAWKRSRYLEFSYLDEGFAIARGSGGEPHFLLRGEL